MQLKNIEDKLTPGQRISKCRKAHKPKLTQEALAELIDCSTQTISNLENDRTALEFEKAYKLAAVFGVSPEYLQAKTENKYYRGDVELALTKMQKYVEMQETFSDYISMLNDFNQCPLSEDEQIDFFHDVEWYAKARMLKMIQEKGESNGKESKKSRQR